MPIFLRVRDSTALVVGGGSLSLPQAAVLPLALFGDDRFKSILPARGMPGRLLTDRPVRLL
jgi:siroheme synthase (precorrin-2 oxidase/ferrochelatase)